jgi:hypothetical protein
MVCRSPAACQSNLQTSGGSHAVPLLGYYRAALSRLGIVSLGTGPGFSRLTSL